MKKSINDWSAYGQSLAEKWRLKEIFQFIVCLSPFALVMVADMATIYYGGSVSEELNVYSDLTYNILPLSAALSGFLFFITFSSRMNFVPLSYVFYPSLVISLLTWPLIVLNTIVNMANGIRLQSGINLIEMEKNEYFNIALSNAEVSTFFIVCITVAMIISKPKKVNHMFIAGLLILPAISNVVFDLFSLVFSDYSYLELGNVFRSQMVKSDPIMEYMTSFLIVILFSLVVYYIYKKKEDIKRNLGFLFLGYFTAISTALIAASLIPSLPSVKSFNNNVNIITVSIHGKEYEIDQSLLSVMDQDTEFMIEAYAGLSMHNSMSQMEYMLSSSYDGDNEKAIKFTADVLLTNLKLYHEKSDKVVNILKNEKLDLGDVISILIPFIIYEVSPLHHQERFLENVLKGKYQKAADALLDDALNNSNVELLPLKMTDEDNQERVGSLGHPIVYAIMANLIRNELIEFDFDKIHDDEMREKAKRLYIGEQSYSSKPVSDETIEEWYEMFKTDRLMN